MALRFSTGLRNAVLDTKAEATNIMTATTISFGDDTGSGTNDQILDSGSGLASFRIREKVTIAGSTSNNVVVELLAVAAGALECAAGSFSTEAAGDQVVLAGAKGGSYSDLFRNGIIHVYSGSQPTDADTVESGTLLVKITLGSGAFVADAAANGINLGEVAAGVLAKEAGETWSGVGLDNGTAGWFRFYDNGYVTGASSTEIRMDGAVATSGSQFNMSSTTIATSGTTTVDSFALTQPAA